MKRNGSGEGGAKRNAREAVYVMRDSGPSVTVKRMAGGMIAYEVTVTAGTVAEAGRLARAEYEAIRSWATPLEEADRETLKRAAMGQDTARKQFEREHQSAFPAPELAVHCDGGLQHKERGGLGTFTPPSD